MGVGEAETVDISGIPEKRALRRELCLKGEGSVTNTPERIGDDKGRRALCPVFLG